MAFWSRKKEPDKLVGRFTDRMREAHHAAKVIGECWNGGLNSFDAAFKKDAPSTFCKMIDRVNEVHGRIWVPRCFNVYWRGLKESDRDELALMFCETAISHEARLRALGEDVD
jgi:hypothetical protein